MTYPIPSHPTWSIIDSSKLEDMRCFRKHFYRNLLGWRPEAISNDLVFGDAVHHALAHLYEHRSFDGDVLAGAYEAFMNVYRPAFPESTDLLFKAKIPDSIPYMLAGYAHEYKTEFTDYEVLYTEVSGSVPVSFEPERRLFFRLDAIVRDTRDGKILIDEHKTTGWSLNDVWASQFFLRPQIGTYTHAGYCIYGSDNCKGVKVNGICFNRNKSGFNITFRRVPCYKDFDHMRVWLWHVNNRLNEHDFELERFADCTPDDQVMTAFPMNPYVCTDYMRLCPYHAFCLAWPNPLRYAFQVPSGFTQEFWNPVAKDSRHKMDLEWKAQPLIFVD